MTPVESYLTPMAIMHNSTISPAIITRQGHSISISHFEKETESTSYLPSPVAILKKNTITDFLLDDLDMILSTKSADRFTRIATILRSSDLLVSDDTTTPISIHDYQDISILLLTNRNITLL